MADPIATNLWDRLTDPSAEITEPERRHNARLLSSLLVILIPVGYLLAAAPILLSSTRPLWQNSDFLIMTASLILSIAIYGLSRGANYQRAVVLVIAVGLLEIFLPSIAQNDFLLSSVDYLLVLVLFGSMFLSSKATLGVIAVSLAGLFVLPVLITGVTFLTLIEDPISLLLIGSGLILLGTRHRNQLEKDRHAALMASEERLRQLIENSEDIIVMQDLSGRYTYYNASPQYGIRAEDLLGKTPYDVHAQASADQIMDRLSQVAATGKGITAESRVNWQGKDLWFSDYSYPVKDQNGQVLSVATISRNITERKRAETDRLKFGLGIERSGEAIFMTNPDGTIIYVNPAFEAIYGFSKAEALGKTPRILKSGVLSEDNYVEFWNTLLAKYSSEREIINKTKDGRLITVESSANPILDDAGDIIGFLAIQRDITDRKRAEEALRSSEAEYRLLFENNPHPMWAFDLETLAFLAVNEAAIHHYGYSREEFLAMTLRDIRPIEDIPALLEDVAKTSKNLNEAGIWRHRTKDGSIIFVEITSHMTTFAGKSVRMVMANDVTERKRVEEQIDVQLHRLSALRDIDQAITSSMDLGVTLNILLAQVTAQLGVDAADILLLDKQMRAFAYSAGRGFRSSAITRARFAIGEGHAGRAALERRMLHADLPADRADAPVALSFIAGEGFVVQYVAPLVAKGRIKGVLEIFHRSPLSPDADWLRFMETLAGQAALAVEDAEMFGDLQRFNTDLVLAYDTTLEGWSRALDLRDRETEGHTQRVTEAAVRLASALGMNDKELVHIRRGALLHDIGKMGIPDSILLKPGTLTEKEWEIMRKHPVYAYDLLAPIAYLRPALDIAHYHHEKWDGTGYPAGLKGEQIPLAARIFAVVDVWDALRSDRPYRAAWSAEQAITQIRSEAGTHFDPTVIDVFMQLLNDGRLPVTPIQSSPNSSR